MVGFIHLWCFLTYDGISTVLVVLMNAVPIISAFSFILVLCVCVCVCMGAAGIIDIDLE